MEWVSSDCTRRPSYLLGVRCDREGVLRRFHRKGFDVPRISIRDWPRKGFWRTNNKYSRWKEIVRMFFRKIISSLILRKLFRKMLSILILRKLFRKLLSSLIFANVILQDVVDHNFYEICSVKKFSSFCCTRVVRRFIIATKLNQKFSTYPWDWSVEVSSSFFWSKI